MQNNVIKFPGTNAHTNVNRYTVLKTISEELYPEERFPAKNFPQLHELLFSIFMEIIKPQEELFDIYRNSKNQNHVRQLTYDLLDFPNLLKERPKSVVLIYQKYIEKFIYYKHSNPHEREDIFQEVLTRLFEVKIYKIQSKYDFDFNKENSESGMENLKKISSFTSYLMVTVRNIYIDIIRERNVRPLTAGDVKEVEDVDVVDVSGGNKMLNRLMINEELIKLKTIFLLYYKTRAKLELCLKLKYRLPISEDEIRGCFPDCNEEDIDILTRDYSILRDKQLFSAILSVFNRYEGKDSKSDSLRKWTNVKVEEIILHLNRTHNYSVYNSKNIADFITLYYQNIHQSNNGDNSEQGQRGQEK